MGILQSYFTGNLYFKKMIQAQKWSTKSSNEHRFEIYAHYQHHWTTHLETYRELTFGKHWGLATKLFQHLQEEKQKLKIKKKKKREQWVKWTLAALVRRSPLSPTEILRTSFCTFISLIGFESFFSEAWNQVHSNS